jgi:hypothetical protein
MGAARARVASVLAFALQRLVAMLESSDDAVALRAARDLLDRGGLAARHAVDLDVSGHVEVGVSVSVSDLTAKLAAVKAASGPSPEEEIITAMAPLWALMATTRRSAVPSTRPWSR